MPGCELSTLLLLLLLHFTTTVDRAGQLTQLGANVKVKVVRGMVHACGIHCTVLPPQRPQVIAEQVSEAINHRVDNL